MEAYKEIEMSNSQYSRKAGTYEPATVIYRNGKTYEFIGHTHEFSEAEIIEAKREARKRHISLLILPEPRDFHEKSIWLESK